MRNAVCSNVGTVSIGRSGLAVSIERQLRSELLRLDHSYAGNSPLNGSSTEIRTKLVEKTDPNDSSMVHE